MRKDRPAERLQIVCVRVAPSDRALLLHLARAERATLSAVLRSLIVRGGRARIAESAVVARLTELAETGSPAADR